MVEICRPNPKKYPTCLHFQLEVSNEFVGNKNDLNENEKQTMCLMERENKGRKEDYVTQRPCFCLNVMGMVML